MNLATQEQQQRARWDLLLLDLEHRAEQVRELKTIDLTNKGYEGKRLVIQAQPLRYSRPVQSSAA